MFHPAPLHSPHYFSTTNHICPTKTLVLEDSLFDQRRFARMARDSALLMTLDFASTIADFSAKLDQTRFDMVFLDYCLPVGSGSNAFDLIKTNDINRNCTIILLANIEGLDARGQRLRQTCDHYLCKDDLTPEHLRAAVLDIKSGLIPRKKLSIA